MRLCSQRLRSFAICLAVAAPVRAQVAADFVKEVRPLLETYCFKCHGNGKKKGGLALDEFTSAEAAIKAPKTWNTVLENLRSGDMPPDDEAKQPSAAQRERLTKWIDFVVLSIDPEHPDPGRVTLRRLNRAEYSNTIRDLVGVSFSPVEDFPTDDSGYGFDNIGDALSMPPVLFARYLAAAEKILSAALLNDHKPRAQTIHAELLQIAGGPKKGGAPNAREIDGNESTLTINLPTPGEYELRLALSSRKIGAEATRIELKLNGQILSTQPLAAPEGRTETINLKVPVAAAGANILSLRVANPLASPELINGKAVLRVFTIRTLDWVSPPVPAKAPPTQLRLLAPGKGQPTADAVARAVVADFARRAFRRPATTPEVDRLMLLYKQAEKWGGNFEQSIQTTLTAVLISPHFLFRGELQPQPDNPKSAAPISEWDLASRLSYFLWSTMPDESLFAEAAQGTLRKNLEAQVRRMLKDPKATMLVENFGGQWLQTRNLKLGAVTIAETFKDWDWRLSAAMVRETELLFENILHEDLSVMDLIAANYTFVNDRLARHYGIEGVNSKDFVKVKLPQNRPGGILGHGSFLTLTSNPTRTSVVKRGKFVLENLLGTPPPPPPADVPDLKDGKSGDSKGTMRERLEQHRKDPLCASCHSRMDPIGFGLENFDAIGAWRDKEGDLPVDSSGQLVSGESFKGPIELRQVLLTKRRGDFLRCISEKILTYALGRGLEHYDRPALEKIASRLANEDSKFSTLILEAVKSVPFQMRRGEGDPRQIAGDSAGAP